MFGNKLGFFDFALEKANIWKGKYKTVLSPIEYNVKLQSTDCLKIEKLIHSVKTHKIVTVL